MNSYLILKTLHLIFLMAFVASTFYLPRILVNIAEAANDGEAVRDRLVLMGLRMYRFGHMMFGFAFIWGLLMWQGYRISETWFPQAFATGAWLHVKLSAVLVMVGYFTYFGRKLKAFAKGQTTLPSARSLRFWNEVPLILLAIIVYMVVAKPF